MHSTHQRSRAPVALLAALVVMAAAFAAIAAVVPAKAAVVPTVTGISPTSGPVAGGTDILIQGSGFTDATGVTFGGVAATMFSVSTDASMTARTPANISGYAQVQVSTEAGTSNNPIYFQYTGTSGGGAVVSSLSPNAGPTAAAPR